MAKTFHLAIPVKDLDKAIEFYCNVLGCKKGNFEDSPLYSWCDIDFWGNELTLHASSCTQNSEAHDVDMGMVLGLHCSYYTMGHQLELYYVLELKYNDDT